MPNPSEVLKEMLDKHPSAPFLFIGSGFSRRYLGLDDWVGLLKRFCEPIRDFGYYNSKANGDLPATASNMAKDYNEWWWSSDDAEESRNVFSTQIKGEADTLKFEISRYLSRFSLDDARGSEHKNEIAQMSEIAVDGIITTNWDTLLEELFPTYKVFVGQDELLFSNPQSIGEIYKIHGCVTQPRSLVLTGNDYIQFTAKNPYLAAKLVTVFVEHPIIFLGYSIADPHIRDIITSIAQCLTQDKITEFQENLIFVQRVKDGEEPAIEKTTIQSEGFSVTLMVAKLADFGDVFEPLIGYKRKIPVRILRFFKEQLYDLIHAPAESERRLAVIDLEDIESAEDVEFIIGAGVAKRAAEHTEKVTQAAESGLTKKGYSGITPEEVFTDCLLDHSQFDGAAILSGAYPSYARSGRTFIPIFRYLQLAEINSEQALESSKYEGAKKLVAKMRKANYSSSSYKSRYQKSFQGLSTAQIIEKASSPTEALLMLPFQEPNQIDMGTLVVFLRQHSGTFNSDPYVTAYRKLVCLYDRLAFGF